MSDDDSPEQAGQASWPRRGPYVGIPGEFDEREDFDSYVARVKLFWKVNKVAEEEKADQFLLFSLDVMLLRS